MRLTLLLGLTIFGLATGQVAEVTEEQYKTAKDAQLALDTLSRTRMLSQKVTKEFYLFLFDIQPEKNAQLVRDDMVLLKEGFSNFSLGIQSFTDDFNAKLDTLNESIQTFEDAIAAFNDVFTFDETTTVTSTTNTLATTTTTTTTTMLRMVLMWPVETGSQALMDQMSVLWEQLTDYVWMKGIYSRLYAYSFVDRKRVLNQELGKFAVLRALGRNMPLGYYQDLATHALFSLLNRMDAFTEGHYGLLEGSAWVGNSMVPDVCLLAQTAYVTYQYEEKVLPELRKVIYRLSITEEDWVYLDDQVNTLLGAVEGNYPFITVVEGKACPKGGCGGRWNRAMECPQVRAAIDDNAWLNAISMLNNNRRVLQEVTRIYLQVVKGYDVLGRIDRLKLRREEFLTTMNRIIQGFTVENVPSPPTQDLSETMQSFLFRNWRPVDEIFRQAIQGKSKTFDGRLEGSDNTTLLLLDKRCNILEDEFLVISSLYIRECPSHLRQRCFMVEASYNQQTAYERMVKEAWFCSLFENSTAFLQRFNYTKDNLTAATIGLVDGLAISDQTIKDERAFWSFKVQRQIQALRADADTAVHTKAFTNSWGLLSGTDAQKTSYLQTCYITKNSYADKSAWEPKNITECRGQEYHDDHRSFFTYWRTLQESNGYADLFLFDMDSNLVYSVMKKQDFATNFLSGSYKDTSLAQTLQAAMLRPKEVHESPWATYAPNGVTEEAAFVCSGIPGTAEETFVGVICIELPAEKGVDIPRTQSYCILNELYLVRKYEAALIDIVESVVYPKNWTEDQMARFTGAYFNDLAPQFVKVSNYYSQADPSCAASRWLQYASIEQWRVAMSTASKLPSFLPMVAKQYFVANKMDAFPGKPAILYAKGLRAQLADTSLTTGRNYLRDLRLGTLDSRLPAAPAQPIVDRDLESLDAWNLFVAAIQQQYKEEDVIPTGNMVYQAIIVFRKLMESFTTYARRSAHSIDELQPGLMELTGDPEIYIEQMAMEAAMLSLWQGSPENLSRSVSAFETALNDLKTDSRTQSERCRVQAVSRVSDSWATIKPDIEMFGTQFTYTERQIVDMMNGTDALYKTASSLQTMFAEVSPTCEFNDSESIRSAGVALFLYGIVTLLKFLA